MLGESRVRSFERMTTGRSARDHDLLELQESGDSDDQPLLNTNLNADSRRAFIPQFPSPTGSTGEADFEGDAELARRLQDHENGQVQRSLCSFPIAAAKTANDGGKRGSDGAADVSVGCKPSCPLS